MGDERDMTRADERRETSADKTDDRKTDHDRDEGRGAKGTGDLKGLGQQGSAQPPEGVAENQGGGIEDAIGGGTSGQGGG